MKGETTSESTATAGLCDQVIDSVIRAVRERPELLNEPKTLLEACRAMSHFAGGTEIAMSLMFKRQLEVWLKLAKAESEKQQLIALIEALKEGCLALAWVLSAPYSTGCNGRAQRCVLAALLSNDGIVPRPFRLADTEDLEAFGDPERRDPDPPAIPFMGLVNPQAGVYVGPVRGLPVIPLPAMLVEAVSARELPNGMGEIEVSVEGVERNYFLPADLAITRAVEGRLADGERVTVRQECGVATSIHVSDRKRDDFVEYIAPEGLQLHDLKMPARMVKEFRRDVRALTQGKPVFRIFVGPTGVGKTTSVFCVLREASRLTGKPAAIVRMSAAYIGSVFIHQTALNMRKGRKAAESLSRRGYIVAILVDEADALLGETDGMEHSHNREERLAFQELFSQGVAGVGVYATMNARKNSWLPPAIVRRGARLVFPRTTRSQMAAVASHYVMEEALASMNVSREEFGAVFADMLYSEHHVVATAHFHSGRSLPIRARDLQICSPGKAESLVKALCEDLADGQPGGLELMQAAIHREFQAAELNTANLFDLTFVTCPHNDTLRTVEVHG